MTTWWIVTYVGLQHVDGWTFYSVVKVYDHMVNSYLCWTPTRWLNFFLESSAVVFHKIQVNVKLAFRKIVFEILLLLKLTEYLINMATLKCSFPIIGLQISEWREISGTIFIFCSFKQLLVFFKMQMLNAIY